MKTSLFSTFFYGLIVMQFLFLNGCVTEYQPDTKTVARSLIVDGLITDQPGPYSVSLRYTSDYSYTYINLLAGGYTLSITDDNGPTQPMTEVSQGVYKTRNATFRGQIGHTYRLHIVSPNGKQYESSLERLNPVAPITRLYWVYHEQDRPGTFLKDKGFNVYLDTQDPETTGNYYRWQWAHYQSTLTCEFGRPCCTIPCWAITCCTGDKCLNVSSDVAINGKQISNQFIMQAPYESRSTYYLEVEQQSLSAGAYRFWHHVDQSVNQNGGIFDAAPVSIQGNIVNKNDPSELVLGYFGASGSIFSALLIDRSLAPSAPNFGVSEDAPSGNCAPCNETIYHTPTKPRWWPN